VDEDTTPSSKVLQNECGAALKGGRANSAQRAHETEQKQTTEYKSFYGYNG